MGRAATQGGATRGDTNGPHRSSRSDHLGRDRRQRGRAAAKDYSVRTLGNAIAGAVGGGIVGQLVGTVAGQAIEGWVGNIGGGAIGGVILYAPSRVHQELHAESVATQRVDLVGWLVLQEHPGEGGMLVG